MRDSYTSIQPKISSNNFCSIELNPITSLEKFSQNGQNLLALAHQTESEALPYLPLQIDLPSMVCALATNSAATKDVNKSSDPILTQLQTLKLNVTSSAATFFFFFLSLARP